MGTTPSGHAMVKNHENDRRFGAGRATVEALMEIQVKKLHTHACTPTYAHATDAGMDLCTVERVEVPARGRALIPTGLAMAIPEGYAGLIRDKSGLATKYGITVLAGVIDSDYRGQIYVALLNTGDQTHVFEVGEKVAQMIIQRVEHPVFVEVSDLETTKRGSGGFGSTGK